MLGSNRGGTLSVGTWRAQPARCNMAHIPAGHLWGLQLWAQHATMEAGVACRGSGLLQPCVIMLNSLHPFFPTVKCDSVLSMDSTLHLLHSHNSVCLKHLTLCTPSPLWCRIGNGYTSLELVDNSLSLVPVLSSDRKLQPSIFKKASMSFLDV